MCIVRQAEDPSYLHSTGEIGLKSTNTSGAEQLEATPSPSSKDQLLVLCLHHSLRLAVIGRRVVWQSPKSIPTKCIGKDT